MKSTSNLKDMVPLISALGFVGAVVTSFMLVLAAAVHEDPAPDPTTTTATTSGPTGFRHATEYGPMCYIITIDGVDTAWTSACSMPCHADPNEVEQ